MLIPDSVYQRLPQLWGWMGALFLISGLMAGTEFRLFGVCILFGILCIVRAFWLYQVRQRVTRRREVTVLSATQRIEKDFGRES